MNLRRTWSLLGPLWMILLGAVLAMPTAAGDDDRAARLLERAFCSPNQTFPQPKAWQEQPILYDRWAKGGDVAITLDQEIYRLLLPVIQRYANDHKQDIRVREGTCGISAGLVSRKQVDIAGFCCPPAVTDRLPGLSFHTLGIASIAILVHPDNPVTGLTFKEVRQIFQGYPRYWSQIRKDSSQPKWPIQTIGRLHCKLRPGHWRTILWDPDDFSPRLEEVGTIPDMIQRVMVQPGAIGFETLSHISRYSANGRPKIILIDNHPPEEINALLHGHYPLYHVFNLTLWEGTGMTNPRAKDLVAYLIRAVEAMDPASSMISASALRQAGWRFQGDELIGEPIR